MFFLFLLGAGLIAVGIGATFGGAWATVGAVVLLAIGLKLLFMILVFGVFRRRARKTWHKKGWGSDENRRAWHEGWDSDDEDRYGPWPCGRRFRGRMGDWHDRARDGREAGSTTGEAAPAAE